MRSEPVTQAQPGKPNGGLHDGPDDVCQDRFSATERVLITGGSGFIGTNLIGACLRRQIPTLNLDPARPRNPKQRHVWTRIDPLDQRAVHAAVAAFRPTIVFYLGARTDLRGKSMADYASNVQGVRVAIGAFNATASIATVVFASTRLVCKIGHQPRHEADYCPTTAYGESKALGEQIVRAADHRYRWIIVRPTSIWGPWFEVPYRDFFKAVAARRYFHIGDSHVRKSFGYVGNTVHALERIACAAATWEHGRTLYLGDYPPTDVREMAELIARETASGPIRTLPRWPLAVAARLGDALQHAGWANPPLTSFRLDNLTTEMVYDLGPLRGLLGALPYSLTVGIRDTVNWMRDQGDF